MIPFWELGGSRLFLYSKTFNNRVVVFKSCLVLLVFLLQGPLIEQVSLIIILLGLIKQHFRKDSLLERRVVLILTVDYPYPSLHFPFTRPFKKGRKPVKKAFKKGQETLKQSLLNPLKKG